MIFRLVIILLSLSFSLFSGEITWKNSETPGFAFTLNAPNGTVSVVSRVQVKVIAKSPLGYSVDREKLRSNLMNYIGYESPPFSLLSEEALKKIDGTEVITYTLNPNIPGEHVLTFGGIVFEPENVGDGKVIKVATGTFSLQVVLSKDIKEYLGLEAPLMPLSARPPVDMSPENREKYVKNPQIIEKELERYRKFSENKDKSYVGYGFFLLFKIMIVFFVLTKTFSKGSKFISQKTAIKNAREHAFETLESLENSNLFNTKKYDLYYDALADTLRSFIEEAYHLKAPTMTTQEFIEHIAKDPILDDDEQIALNRFLQYADIVKFAKQMPTQDKCRDAFEMTKEVIEQLIPETQIFSPTESVGIRKLGTLLKQFIGKG